MKIRITKTIEINGTAWQPGWVGGFDESFARGLIAEGKAAEVPDDARTFKFDPTETKLTECIPEPGAIEAQTQAKEALTFKK
jgi:hypothetical protein